MQSIAKELRPELFIAQSAGLDIYMVDAGSAPKIVREIGKIREREFRQEGGGTGKDLDLDDHDLSPPWYRQLLAWDAQEKEIVAMYRFFRGADVDDYQKQLASGKLFEFSPEFLRNYLSCTIELGRSVVNRSARRSYRGLFAIWSGLGALACEYPNTRYFFGKFTVFPDFHPQVRTAMYSMLKQWCGNALVSPRHRHRVSYNPDSWKKGKSFRDDLSRLIRFSLDHETALPPLVLSYARLSDNMKVFGTAHNTAFGNVEETAILISIEHIYPHIRQKFIDSYTSINPQAFFS